MRSARRAVSSSVKLELRRVLEAQLRGDRPLQEAVGRLQPVDATPLRTSSSPSTLT